jgi:hypothetical protein
MPAKYLKSEKYLKIRAKIEQEYLDLIESNPDIETKLQALCRKEEVQG